MNNLSTKLATNLSNNEVDRQTLEELEQCIANGAQGFVEVGNALNRIRLSKLYKLKGYSNFRHYCQKRWNFGKSRVYQLIDAANVAVNVSTISGQFLNERQCRELAKLKTPQQQQAALDKVIENSSDGNITAVAIERVVKKMQSTISHSDSLSIPPLKTIVRIVGSNPDLAQLHDGTGYCGRGSRIFG